MELIPAEIQSKLPQFYSTEKQKDPLCIVRLFNPCGAGIWYIIEYESETHLAYGYSIIHEAELGYFSIDELECITLPFDMRIERDVFFEPKLLSQIRCEFESLAVD